MDKIVAFFKPPDPKTLAKQWQSKIRKEQRQLDAQVRDIERELAKSTREIKACLKRKDARSAKVLAIQVCKARKTIESLYETKANYNSISMRLGESVGRLTQVGSLGKSSEILKVRAHLHANWCIRFEAPRFLYSVLPAARVVLTSLRHAPSFAQSMNAIANVGQASKDVVAMSKEMFKMGVIEDVLEDTLAMTTFSTEEDDETDKEVDAILKEIAGEVSGTLPEKVSVAAAATSSFAAAAKENQPVPEGNGIDESDMQSRLDALRE